MREPGGSVRPANIVLKKTRAKKRSAQTVNPHYRPLFIWWKMTRDSIGVVSAPIALICLNQRSDHIHVTLQPRVSSWDSNTL